MDVVQSDDDDGVFSSKKSIMTRKIKKSLKILSIVLLMTVVLFYSMYPQRSKERLEITLVTAYFDLGTFAKGSSEKQYTPNDYKTWITVFSLIKNPVIFYVEKSSPLISLIQQFRSKFPERITTIYEVERAELWSFKLLPRIAKIYSRAGYPKHLPNTVLPEYSAAMHAKYELMKRAIEINPFDCNYFAWTDVGLFRGLVPIANSTKNFRLVLPTELIKSQSIAYSQVYDFQPNLDASTIVINNMVWVGGAYFVGRSDALLHWTAEYVNGVERMMNETNFMSTDQQIIYWLFSNKQKFKIKTHIKTYSGKDYDPWFYLGYLSRVYDPSN